MVQPERTSQTPTTARNKSATLLKLPSTIDAS